MTFYTLYQLCSKDGHCSILQYAVLNFFGTLPDEMNVKKEIGFTRCCPIIAFAAVCAWSSVSGEQIGYSRCGSDVVRVSERFGFSPDDSTECLQKAIDSGAATIVIEKMPSPWIVRPLKGRSNLRIVFEKGAEVKAKKGAFRDAGDKLFSFEDCNDVALIGPGAVISMNREDYMRPPYVNSEYRHALSFGSGCRNILIEGLEIRSSGGDGIYFGAGHNGFCSNIVVRNVSVDDNYRQAMSVISVDGMLVENSRFANTKGTPPAAGIDFEPNFQSHRISNVLIRNCVLENNEGSGLDFHLCSLDSLSHKVSVDVMDCVVRGNAIGVYVGGNAEKGDGVLGRITVKGCSVESHRRGCIAYDKGSGRSLDVSYENCRMKPLDGTKFKPITKADIDATTTCPVFVNGTAQILDRKTDFGKARPVDERPGEVVRFPPLFCRYQGVYVFYSFGARKVHFLAQASRLLPKFSYPTMPLKVMTIDGRDVARIPMIEAGEAAEIAFDVPSAGFYRISVNCGVGGLFALCGTDVPVAIDTTQESQPFVRPRGTLYFEVPLATEDAAIGFNGGGAGENVSVVLRTPAERVEWQSDEVGVVHRFRFKHPREIGLWSLAFDRPSKGMFEDAGVQTFGCVPGCYFLTSQKRWTWCAKLKSTNKQINKGVVE